ncbi:MAG: pyridoxamine 5'-phosphate oxidase [Bdellovibrionales bacterium]
MNSNKLKKHFITKNIFPMISETKDPNELFKTWLSEAEEHEINNYNALNLATVGANNRPSNRMVLLKGYDENGFVIYTNYESRKGQEILNNGFCSMCFHWKSLKRQLRIEGQIISVTNEEADKYFATRDRQSQISAWASKQSRPLEKRQDFEDRLQKYTEKFADMESVPRPPHWSGFRVIADRIEFWQEMPYRQHDRVVYTRTDADKDAWTTHRLYP